MRFVFRIEERSRGPHYLAGNRRYPCLGAWRRDACQEIQTTDARRLGDVSALSRRRRRALRCTTNPTMPRYKLWRKNIRTLLRALQNVCKEKRNPHQRRPARELPPMTSERKTRSANPSYRPAPPRKAVFSSAQITPHCLRNNRDCHNFLSNFPIFYNCLSSPY